MLYYQVNKNGAQKPVSIRFKDDFLIEEELYTDSEVTRALNKGWVNSFYIREYLTPIDINPKNTFFFFGSRRLKQNQSL